MRTPILAGNWKMNGCKESVASLLSGLKEAAEQWEGFQCIIFPPYVYLPQVVRICTGSHLLWGAQNVSEHLKGAFTGEIAASMLQDFACRYVLIGHSERRHLYHETDAQLAKKFAVVYDNGMQAVLCVGETLSERQAGQEQTCIARQLDAVLSEVKPEAWAEAVIAYEPVWAIGTGETASPEQAQAMHAFIRQYIAQKNAEIAQNIPILYGGSVKAHNASALFAMPDIDGGLVGGASLHLQEFLEIARCMHCY